MRRAVTLVALTVAVASTLAAVAAPASADNVRQRRDQIVRQRGALKVQIDLARASDHAVEAEANRLSTAVAAEQRLLVFAQQQLDAADARVADSLRRLQDIQARSAAARAALVGRAVALYEHPFQTEQVALDGVASLTEYAQRQALVAVIEGRTSDIIDEFRQENLDEQAANRDLYAARADADHRRADVQTEEQRLESARLAADVAHAALQKRIADLSDESQALARQEASLEAQLAANEAQFGGFTSSLGRLVWPVHGPVTREFGEQAGGFHPGIDIAPPYGTPIHASAGGVVIYAGWEDGYGNYTCINHGGGIATCYAHQSQIGVSVGQTVRQGQVIGLEGSTGHSTGPHVHFEVRVNNAPENPRRFIPGNP